MKIAGLQKLTLLDFPGRCAATVFTPGCNFRCPFCHNASLVEDGDSPVYADGSNMSALIDEDDLLAFLKQRFGKLTGLAVTGGEPLMQDGIEEFLLKVRELGYAIKLDTNGSYPEKLKKILSLGIVEHVAMDIKNTWAKYGITTGAGSGELSAARVKESMDFLKKSGVSCEFRTTVIAELHTAEDIEEIAKEVGTDFPFYIQCFKDSGDILRAGCSAPDTEVLKEFLRSARKHAPQAQLRGVDL